MGGRRSAFSWAACRASGSCRCETGEAVHAALVDRGHDAVKLFVDRDLDLALRAERIDVAFLALHGRYGEDGCVQGLLELLGHPLHRLGRAGVGAGDGQAQGQGAVPAAQPADAALLRASPRRRRGRSSSTARSASRRWSSRAREGSSLGVRRADDADELEAAVEEALRFDDDVLVERFVEGARAARGGARRARARLGRARGRRRHLRLRGARRRRADAACSCRRGCRPERLRGVLTLAERAAARARVHRAGRGGPDRLRARQRVRARGRHAAGADAASRCCPRSRTRPGWIRRAGARRCCSSARLHAARRTVGDARLRLDERNVPGRIGARSRRSRTRNADARSSSACVALAAAGGGAWGMSSWRTCIRRWRPTLRAALARAARRRRGAMSVGGARLGWPRGSWRSTWPPASWARRASPSTSTRGRRWAARDGSRGCASSGWRPSSAPSVRSRRPARTGTRASRSGT